MGNASILGHHDPEPQSPDTPRWTPNEHNGILGWVGHEYLKVHKSHLPAPEKVNEKQAQHQVEIDHPEVGRVRITFRLHRQSRKGFPPFWSACFAELVKEKPPEGG